MTEIKFLGDYINGKFVKPEESDGDWSIQSPADLKDKVISPSFYYSHIDAATEAAAEAFKSWRRLSLDERKEYLLRLQEIYLSKAEQLAEIISRETGKPFWESKTEAAAMAGKIKITLEHSLKLVSESVVENALPNVDGVIRYKPRGVMSVIGPFNFPGHLPNGHIVPALITGNTVVFKPSDKTPAVGQFMAEMFHEANFPPGVFNLVQGQGETGRRLVGSEHVDGVLFTGSYEVGLKIKQETINHYWKILALEMGGKNSAVIWDDADLDKAVYENILGAYFTAGQRCSCTSKIIVHKKVKDRFIENFYENSKKIKIGHWKTDSFMGPLIGDESVNNYLRFQEIAKRDDTECIMRGKALELDPHGHYVTPSIYFVNKFNPESIYQNTEIFGPNVAIYEVDDYDQALEIVNASSYGLVASVFSKQRELYERAVLEAKVGLVNWNRTTNGASSRLPFGGMGKSGNDRPSAHFAVQYCTVPVGSLEDETKLDHSKLLPTIDYTFK